MPEPFPSEAGRLDAIATELHRKAAEDDVARLRTEFLRLLTVDSETKDRRRREFNQAIFNADEGWAVWSDTTLDMVLSKFDKAAAALRERAK